MRVCAVHGAIPLKWKFAEGGTMRYALLSYNRTNNLGDEVQSLAARRFLPRVDEFVERDQLADFRPKEMTRIICNGWFLHNPEKFDLRENVEPLLVSFHATPRRGRGLSFSFVDMLRQVPEVCELLKRAGPVGARDLYTWKLMKGLSVPTYFSGCLTLTFNRPEAAQREEQIVMTDVDPVVAARVRAVTDRNILMIKHRFNRMIESTASFCRAERLLDIYARAHLVVTSRLHVMLPCLAFGTPVILVGNHLSDPRFDGLKDLCNHSTIDNFAALPDEWFDKPEPNPRRHLGLRTELIDRVQTFAAEGRDQANRIEPQHMATAGALVRHLDGELLRLNERIKELESTRENGLAEWQKSSGVGGPRRPT